MTDIILTAKNRVMTDFFEENLEDIIYNSDREALSEKGLLLKGRLFRQLKIGGYGIADLVTAERRGIADRSYMEITVYELKRKEINNETFFQAVSYARGIQRYLLNKRHFKEFNIKICLIGKSTKMNDDFVLLPGLFRLNLRANKTVTGSLIDVDIKEYRYSLKGLEFSPNRMEATKENEGFLL